MKKIVLVGCGSVGCSFIYSAINNKIADEYVLIDVFNEFAKGHAMDFTDAVGMLGNWDTNPVIKEGIYSDCKDADVVVVCAGRPQKDSKESRLQLVKDNAEIIKEIARNIKASGFNGITIIASNPVDVMTMVYQKESGFTDSKVIGSGTSLDTSRLKLFLSKKLNINPSDVNMYVMGEHGDSSIVSMNCGSILSRPVKELIKENIITKNEIMEIHNKVVQRAYEIISRKKVTNYGIGYCLMVLCSSILNNTNSIHAVSCYLKGEFQNKNVYIGVPAIIGRNGIKKIIEFKLDDDEQVKFNNSCNTILKTFNDAY